MLIKPSSIKITTSIAALAFSALMVCSGFGLAAKPAHRSAAARLITHEVSLGKSAPGEVRYSRVTSADQKHIAFTVKTNGGEFVMIDGLAGKTYTSILRYPLTEAGVTQQIKFSPDGRRVAYVAQHGQKFLVVADGKEGPEFDRLGVGAPNFSPDSRRLAYFAERGGKTLAVIDGVESKPFDGSSIAAPIFSPDSRRVVYLANYGKGTHIVIDGVETAEPEYVGEPRFSKTGKRMSYVVVRQDNWYVVTDGREGKAYRGLGNNIEFSEDERHVLYRADLTEGQVIVVDGVEMQPRSVIQENSYGFSPDGQRVAFSALESRDAEYVVVDNKKGKIYEGVGKPVFSPDSRHVIHSAWAARKVFVVTDGVEGEAFDDVNDNFQFSPDGKHMLYLARREGRQFMVLDGVATAYEQVREFKFSPDSKRLFVAAKPKAILIALEGEAPKKYEFAPATPGGEADDDDFQMAFSPDSKRSALVAQRGGKSFVVSDGVEGKAYDKIQNLQFTSDNRHLVYAAKRDGKLVAVVDGIESKPYDDLIGGASLVIDGARNVRMLVTRGQEILRVEIEIAE